MPCCARGLITQIIKLESKQRPKWNPIVFTFDSRACSGKGFFSRLPQARKRALSGLQKFSKLPLLTAAAKAKGHSMPITVLNRFPIRPLLAGEAGAHQEDLLLAVVHPIGSPTDRLIDCSLLHFLYHHLLLHILYRHPLLRREQRRRRTRSWPTAARRCRTRRNASRSTWAGATRPSSSRWTCSSRPAAARRRRTPTLSPAAPPALPTRRARPAPAAARSASRRPSPPSVSLQRFFPRLTFFARKLVQQAYFASSLADLTFRQ